MSSIIKLIDFDEQELLDYTKLQLASFLPAIKFSQSYSIIDKYFSEALERLRICINSVRLWRPNYFDPLHSSQYSIYLYYLSNCIWRDIGDAQRVPTLLFSLNKFLNGIDMFYEITLPDKFFIGHTIGIVLCKATYSNYLALYQGVTVGKNHGIAPVIDRRVLLYPGSKIIGDSHIKSNTIVSAGVNVINCCPPSSSIVFTGSDGKCAFKPIKKNGLADIFFDHE